MMEAVPQLRYSLPRYVWDCVKLTKINYDRVSLFSKATFLSLISSEFSWFVFSPGEAHPITLYMHLNCLDYN